MLPRYRGADGADGGPGREQPPPQPATGLGSSSGRLRGGAPGGNGLMGWVRDPVGSARAAVAPGEAQRRTATRLAVLAVLVGVVWYVDKVAGEAGSGVGGRGFANIAVQCVFKSYASVDHYSKSDTVYSSVTDVLTRKNPNGVTYFSADFGTDKMSRHNYTDYYDIILAPYLQDPGLALLEIGVKKGGSIKLWRELFQPTARIYGADTDQGIPAFPKDGNIKTVVADSRSLDMKRAFQNLRLDVVVDDGLHTKSAQYTTFKNLARSLTPTGVYIIEDVYHFDGALYSKRPWAMDYAVHADTSGEMLVILYPPESKAARTTLGLIESGGPTSKQHRKV